MISKWHARLRDIWAAFSNSKNWYLCLFGFAAGLPLALTGNGGTLQAWLTTEGVDIKSIAWLGWAGIPYTIKFLWAPLVDRYIPPFLGRRRGWIFLMQIGLAICILGIGFTAPVSQLPIVAFIATTIAVLSATQDIAVDAYRTDLLSATERGMGVSTYVFGYRIAILVSGGLALIIADTIGWRPTFIFLGLLYIPSLTALFVAPEPKVDHTPKNYNEAVIDPIKALLLRPGFLLIAGLIVFYKFGDAFAESLLSTFLLKGVGFSLSDVGYVNKGVGLVALLFGVFLGGVLMSKLSIYRALLYFGILQAVTNLGFWLLAVVGQSYPVFVGVIIVEKIASGLGTTAFMWFLMSLCDKRYSATQYALLSALASVGRVYLSPLSGELVTRYGWANFYLITVLAALPGIFIVVALRKTLLAHEAAEKVKNENQQNEVT